MQMLIWEFIYAQLTLYWVQNWGCELLEKHDMWLIFFMMLLLLLNYIEYVTKRNSVSQSVLRYIDQHCHRLRQLSIERTSIPPLADDISQQTHISLRNLGLKKITLHNVSLKPVTQDADSFIGVRKSITICKDPFFSFFFDIIRIWYFFLLYEYIAANNEMKYLRLFQLAPNWERGLWKWKIKYLETYSITLLCWKVGTKSEKRWCLPLAYKFWSLQKLYFNNISLII